MTQEGFQLLLHNQGKIEENILHLEEDVDNKFNSFNIRVDGKFEDMASKLDLLIATGNKTLIQTTQTNGRVNSLEEVNKAIKADILDFGENLEILNAWKARMGGVWFTLMLVFGSITSIGGLIIGIISIYKGVNL